MSKKIVLSTLLFFCSFLLIAQSSRLELYKNFTKNSIQLKSVPQQKNKLQVSYTEKQIQANDFKRFKSNSNILKVSKNSSASPISLFNRPTGTYIPSLIGNGEPEYLGYSYSYPGFSGSAFSLPWTFRNLSTDATSYSWDWGESVGFSSEMNLIIKNDSDEFLSPGAYYSPKLTATNSTGSNIYDAAGGSAGFSTIYASYVINYVGNADYFANASEANSSGNSIFYVGASGGTSLDGTGKGYFWGTCKRTADGVNGTKVDAIYSFYEKPMSTLTVKDICYFGLNADGKLPVPAGKFLYVNIIRVDDEGKLTTDTLASSKLAGSEAIMDEYDNVYLPFTFTLVDPETGFDSPAIIELNTSFAIVLSGLNQDGMDFGLLCDYANKIENTSYFSKVDAVTGVSDDNLYSSSSTNMNIYLTMNSYFNYLYVHPGTRSMTAPVEGGSAVDLINAEPGTVIYSFFDAVDSLTNESMIWLKDSLPEWLTISYDNSYFKDYGVIIFDFIATSLPNEVSGRQATIIFQSYGAEASVNVKQGIVSGVKNTNESKVKISNSSTSFGLKYPTDYTKLKVYTISGQLISQFNLPANGEFNLLKGNLNRGIYLLKFDGKATETIKIVR